MLSAAFLASMSITQCTAALWTLQANKSSVNPGPIELVYPISIKGAPPVLLTLRAHVQVPDLKLSQEVRARRALWVNDLIKHRICNAAG